MGENADILLVEDDADLCTVLAELLGEYGHQVVTARNGQEALNFLRANLPPRVILLDLTMPVMSGAEFCRLRALDATLLPVPVFLLTARGDPDSQLEALGVSRVFRKPLDMAALLEALSDVLER